MRLFTPICYPLVVVPVLVWLSPVLRGVEVESAKSIEISNQPRMLDANEKAILKIFDQAVSEGKVSVESLAGARGIILSGAYDAKSLAHVRVALAYCLSQLTNNEQERADYLRIANEARAEYIKLDEADRPEERLSYLGHQLQKCDPNSVEFQEYVAEIRKIMKESMDERYALTTELRRKAQEARRTIAENEEKIAIIKERMKERKRLRAEQGD